MKILAIKNYLICAAIALAVGFAVGFDTKGRFIQAAHLEAISQARRGDVAIVANAEKQHQRFSAAIQENSNFFATKQREFDLLSELVEQELVADINDDKPTLICPSDPVLSDGLVRLLNDNP